MYALPADDEERMDELLARGDRDGVVEAALSSSTSRATVAMTSRSGSAVSRAPPMVTAPRGEPMVGGGRSHRVELDDTKRLSRAKVVDPSFFNWPALPVALTDTIVPDFTLANKSFNQSCAGNDL